MRLDDRCARPGCDTPLTPGMYAYQVGALLYCQKCVQRVHIGADLVGSVPAQRQSREYGTLSSEKVEVILSDPS